MSGDVRLDRLYPALSAQERAILVLRHAKDSTTEHPTLRSTMPASQIPEFNRLIAIIRAVNGDLTSIILISCEQVKHIDVKYGWLMSLVLCGREAEDFAEMLLAKSKSPRLCDDIRAFLHRSPGSLELPIDAAVPDEKEEGFGAALMRSLLIGIKDGLDQLWPELRSIEVGLEEAEREFNGEDVLRADVRDRLDRATATCREVHERVQPYFMAFDLREPADDDVQIVRKLIDTAIG